MWSCSQRKNQINRGVSSRPQLACPRLGASAWKEVRGTRVSEKTVTKDFAAVLRRAYECVANELLETARTLAVSPTRHRDRCLCCSESTTNRSGSHDWPVSTEPPPLPSQRRGTSKARRESQLRSAWCFAAWPLFGPLLAFAALVGEMGQRCTFPIKAAMEVPVKSLSAATSKNATQFK